MRSAGAKAHRQGRQISKSNKAEKPTRNAVVPKEPTTGNNCLASEVPKPKAVTEPKTANSGKAW